jgi:hypothetical protein
VAAVAAVAAVISYCHAYELVSAHGEAGLTARLLPFTVDGLILAASMLILDASRRGQLAPPLARWFLGTGIVATISANMAHGIGHGLIGSLVSAWPALALAGSFELLMTPDPCHTRHIDGRAERHHRALAFPTPQRYRPIGGPSLWFAAQEYLIRGFGFKLLAAHPY